MLVSHFCVLYDQESSNAPCQLEYIYQKPKLLVSCVFGIVFIVFMAQTFTAFRVKQELAKEAILPWSLQLASGTDSLLS